MASTSLHVLLTVMMFLCNVLLISVSVGVSLFCDCVCKYNTVFFASFGREQAPHVEEKMSRIVIK